MSWDRSKGRPEPIQALNRISEHDNGEPLVLLEEVCPSVVILRTSVIPYLRKSVATMLEQAAQKVGPDFKIGVVDAWRPFQRQVRIYEWMWQNLVEAKPDLPYAARRRTICRFVAPIDQKTPPGHTTGGAVDVWLLTPDGETADTTSPFARLDGAPTYVYGLKPEAHANRMRLVEAMLSSGFSNCRDEWWHYSYGDAGWAVRTGLTECFYGRIDMPEEVYAEK
ncbi:MAG: M15 family metallopeptidase, partial [Armatimonadota bacterium]